MKEIICWVKENSKHYLAWEPWHVIMYHGTIKSCSVSSKWGQNGTRNVYSFHDEFLILKSNQLRVPFYSIYVKKKIIRARRIWEKPISTEKEIFIIGFVKFRVYKFNINTYFLHQSCKIFYYKGKYILMSSLPPQ